MTDTHHAGHGGNAGGSASKTVAARFAEVVCMPAWTAAAANLVVWIVGDVAGAFLPPLIGYTSQTVVLYAVAVVAWWRITAPR